MSSKSYLNQFIKEQRYTNELTQKELAAKAGVGLRFIRELEQGKTTLRMDKVNQVLELFGHQLIPARELDPYKIMREYIDKSVKVYLQNKTSLEGIILKEIREHNKIKGWEFIKNNHAKDYKKTKDSNLITIIAHKDIERIIDI